MKKYFSYQRIDGAVRTIQEPEDDLIDDLKRSSQVLRYYGPVMAKDREAAERTAKTYFAHQQQEGR
jgi:hypothetical protein